jgi:exodeoxyribonuclease-3
LRQLKRDSGLRIDCALLSATVAERLLSAEPDRGERDQTQPSDHGPLAIELS